MALKVPEPYAVKIARTVLRGFRLPGGAKLNVEESNHIDLIDSNLKLHIKQGVYIG
jgi:hypothetical protein